MDAILLQKIRDRVQSLTRLEYGSLNTSIYLQEIRDAVLGLTTNPEKYGTLNEVIYLQQIRNAILGVPDGEYGSLSAAIYLQEIRNAYQSLTGVVYGSLDEDIYLAEIEPIASSGDTTAPTVTITSTETSPTFAATIPLTITFSEPVTGFVVGDITVAGCTLGALGGSGAVYTVTATPTAATITVDIAAGVCTDLAGNANLAATQFTIVSGAYGLVDRCDFGDITKLFQTDLGTPVTADGQTIGSMTGSAGTQSTAGARPLYKTNIQNGKSAALFDGTNDRFVLPNSFLNGVSAATYYVVGKKAADPPVVDTKSGPALGGIGGGSDEVFPFTDGIIYDRFATTVRKTVGNPTPSMASAFIYDASSAANDWTARINGTALFNTTTNTVGIQPINKFIGSSYNGSYWYDGYILEQLVYSIQHTLAEKQVFETFLNTKWAVF